MKLEVFLHPLASNSRTIYVLTKLHYLVQCLFDFDSVLDSMDPEILFISYNNPAENKKQVVIQTRCTVLAAIRAMISARITAPQPLLMPEDSWKLQSYIIHLLHNLCFRCNVNRKQIARLALENQ
uniref:Uncharacterized protein n=1 Tax=Noccaea caerulescens TaxID=107243 RepID=A0A1J3GW22_NOCCA